MKKLINFILIGLFLSISLTQAYQYPFFNHTLEPIAIAIQFIGGNEPLYKKLIRPQTSEIFAEGKFGIPFIKSSFCIQNIYFIKSPNKEEKKNNYENALWRKIPVLWTPLDIYQNIMKHLQGQETARIKKIAPEPEDITPALSTLIKSIRPTKPQTLCTDRRFEIVEDELGHFYIIAPIRK